MIAVEDRGDIIEADSNLNDAVMISDDDGDDDVVVDSNCDNGHRGGDE